MKLRSKHNGGLVEVDDELGERLLAGGQWAKPRRRSQKTEETPDLAAWLEAEAAFLEAQNTGA